MKFNVKSGNVLESLWHDPGRGSGTCVRVWVGKFNYIFCREIEKIKLSLYHTTIL